MEINRTLPAAPVTPLEATSRHDREPSSVPASVASLHSRESSMPLETLQEALRELPEIDLDRVLALRELLREKGLDTRPDSLARVMLGHHRGQEG
ncbi:flagellar biosynthesis anti-sigma factor FlgM [Metapseudomonas otitidis]|uniref:flagellar biosynthesis anti-sigma factor FlgM n=1 Tax=Metapseudomonas otitidis TaxID=319939 RepID=UPI0039FC69AD